MSTVMGLKNKNTGQTGIGFYDITNNFCYKARLNRHLLINTVEAAAASYSAKYLFSYHPSAPSLIITDSLSTCRKLDKPDDSEPRLDILQAIQKLSHNISINRGSLSILWIPAHINLYGHDRTDQLAKEGIQCDLFHDMRYSVQELKTITKSNFEKPKLQAYWTEARTGTYGRTIIPHFENKLNINKFTNKLSDTQLLIRLIFGTAQFHIGRNQACQACQSNLSIEHAVLHCILFNRTRDILKNQLNRISIEFSLKNILELSCHKSILETRNRLVREINETFTI